MTAFLQNVFKTCQIGAESQEHRAVGNMSLVACWYGKLLLDIRIAYHDHAVALNVRRCRCPEGRAKYGVNLIIGNRAFIEFSNAASLQQCLDCLAIRLLFP